MQYDPDYHGETILKDDIPSGYEYEYGFDEPDVVGQNYEFDVSLILSHREKYSEFITILGDDCFTYKEEYDAAREYLGMLLEKQHPKSKNLFDLFQ